MATYERSIWISKNLNETYKIAERYPEFIDFYRKKEIVYEDETHSGVKIESIFWGLKFTWEGRGVKEKNKKITWTQSKGLLRGMKAEWIFSNSGGPTRVTLIISYQSHIPIWEHIAVLVFIRKTVPRILNCLQTACEHP